MYHRLNDRYLWLGAGIFLSLAIKGISHAIHDILHLTEVTPLQTIAEKDESQAQPEDLISLSVLHTLATSHNPNIAKSAANLIVARCIKAPSLVSAVQADAVSADPELKRKARVAMAFLGKWAVGSEMENALPTGMRTGALNLPPSMVSLDSAFDIGDEMVLAARSANFRADEGGDAAVWTTIVRDGPSSTEANPRRRNREAMVLQGGSEEQEEEEFIHTRIRPT